MAPAGSEQRVQQRVLQPAAESALPRSAGSGNPRQAVRQRQIPPCFARSGTRTRCCSGGRIRRLPDHARTGRRWHARTRSRRQAETSGAGDRCAGDSGRDGAFQPNRSDGRAEWRLRAIRQTASHTVLLLPQSGGEEGAERWPYHNIPVEAHKLPEGGGQGTQPEELAAAV